MPISVSERYDALVAGGRIERDGAQEAVLAKLADLEGKLAAHRLARKSSSLGWLFGSRERGASIKGLYLYGDVGRGKTMLMDLFFEATSVGRKRRAHFYEFMAEVHERMHNFRHQIKNCEAAGGDAVLLAAAAIAKETRLLYLDEFHVTDVADAMILSRLFTQLLEHGVVLLATSNVAPGDLYRDGLNRGLFLPFIASLRKHMDILRLEARTDFRLEKLVRGKVWHFPADAAAEAALNAAWSRLTLGEGGKPLDVTVKGHVLRVPRAAHGAARFTFHELCERALGASDYLRLAREFHTIVLDRVPVMAYGQRNEAKRFIALIDTLYDNAVKLIASAQAAPHDLYRASEGFEAQEFKRTASRLIEMGAQFYLGLPHGSHGSAPADRIVDT
jgi:cell division protein ZapE